MKKVLSLLLCFLLLLAGKYSSQAQVVPSASWMPFQAGKVYTYSAEVGGKTYFHHFQVGDSGRGNFRYNPMMIAPSEFGTAEPNMPGLDTVTPLQAPWGPFATLTEVLRPINLFGSGFYKTADGKVRLYSLGLRPNDGTLYDTTWLIVPTAAMSGIYRDTANPYTIRIEKGVSMGDSILRVFRDTSSTLLLELNKQNGLRYGSNWHKIQLEVFPYLRSGGVATVFNRIAVTNGGRPMQFPIPQELVLQAGDSLTVFSLILDQSSCVSSERNIVRLKVDGQPINQGTSLFGITKREMTLSRGPGLPGTPSFYTQRDTINMIPSGTVTPSASGLTSFYLTGEVNNRYKLGPEYMLPNDTNLYANLTSLYGLDIVRYQIAGGEAVQGMTYFPDIDVSRAEYVRGLGFAVSYPGGCWMNESYITCHSRPGPARYPDLGLCTPEDYVLSARQVASQQLRLRQTGDVVELVGANISGLELYDLQGKKMRQSGSNILDTAGLLPGLYILMHVGGPRSARFKVQVL
jgi:hypothetical protein